MKAQTLVRKYLPQNQDIEVLVPNYKEPILPVNHGGFGWYGLMAYNGQGQLMCHECGKFQNSLSNHIKKHNLKSKEYRKKYGLLCKRRLTSESLHLKMVSKSKNTQFHKGNHSGKIITREIRKNEVYNKKSHYYALELYNRYDTCPAQILRQLSEISGKVGIEITVSQVKAENPNLVGLLQDRFGSFNKAKQILKLSLNKQGRQERFSRRLLLEDMCAFYNKYRHWPMIKDYWAGKMICNNRPIQANGGILNLRQEAMKLREQQEAARIRGEQVVQYANKIEFENAGYARR